MRVDVPVGGRLRAVADGAVPCFASGWRGGGGDGGGGGAVFFLGVSGDGGFVEALAAAAVGFLAGFEGGADGGGRGGGVGSVGRRGVLLLLLLLLGFEDVVLDGPDLPFVPIRVGLCGAVGRKGGGGGGIGGRRMEQGPFEAEEIHVFLLRADEVRAAEAHEPERHARDLALQLPQHGQRVRVQVVGRGDGSRRHHLPRQHLVRVQLDLEDQRAAFVLRARQVLFQLLGDPAQLGPEFFLAAHVAERTFGADAFPLVLFGGTHAGVPEAEVDLHEEVEGFLAEELGKGGAVRVDVAAGFDADSVQFALEDAADAVDFSGG